MNTLRIVHEAVAELNASDTTQTIPLSDDARLYGEDGYLDSIKLLWLVSLIEAKVEEQLNVSVSLSDEKAFSLRNSPFKTIASLVTYLSDRVATQANAPAGGAQ